MNADIRLITPMDQPPKPYSLQRAIQKVSTAHPPLVIEYNGVNHFDAWVRDLTYHKGHRILDGLLEAFPKLGRRRSQPRDKGSGRCRRRRTRVSRGGAPEVAASARNSGETCESFDRRSELSDVKTCGRWATTHLKCTHLGDRRSEVHTSGRRKV